MTSERLGEMFKGISARVNGGTSGPVKRAVIFLVTWFLVVWVRETGLQTLQSTLATLVGWWLT